MKISKPAIILTAAGLGLTLVYSQQSASDTPTKAQQILRQKLTDMKAGETLPGKGAEQVLQPKIAQLRTEERTNIVPDKTTVTLAPEVEAKARELLQAQMASSRKEEFTSPQPNPEAQAKALAYLHQRDAELRSG